MHEFSIFQFQLICMGQLEVYFSINKHEKFMKNLFDARFYGRLQLLVHYLLCFCSQHVRLFEICKSIAKGKCYESCLGMGWQRVGSWHKGSISSCKYFCENMLKEKGFIWVWFIEKCIFENTLANWSNKTTKTEKNLLYWESHRRNKYRAN